MLEIHWVVSECAYKTAVWVVVIFTMLIGVWFMLHPKGALNFQASAYRLAGWKIEPLRPEHELRVTRLAGMAAIVISALTSIVMAARAVGLCAL